jgi:hypothetical protein
MKKTLTIIAGLALVAGLGLTGCNKAKDGATKDGGGAAAVDTIKKDICTPEKLMDIVMSDAIIEFMTRATYDKAANEALGIKSEDEAVKKNKEESAKTKADMKNNAFEFESCGAETKEVKCEDAYAAIAKELGAGGVIKVDEKKIVDIGTKMGIKNCSQITLTSKMKKKATDTEAPAETKKSMYMGETGGKVQVFYLIAPAG